MPLLHARGVFNYDVGLMPYRHRIDSVGMLPLPSCLYGEHSTKGKIVGRPIFPLQKTSEPTDAEVTELQERYINEIQRLWDEWKDVFAKDRRPGAEGELQIIE